LEPMYLITLGVAGYRDPRLDATARGRWKPLGTGADCRAECRAFGVAATPAAPRP
jgi:hypothetical protein